MNTPTFGGLCTTFHDKPAPVRFLLRWSIRILVALWANVTCQVLSVIFHDLLPQPGLPVYDHNSPGGFNWIGFFLTGLVIVTNLAISGVLGLAAYRITVSLKFDYFYGLASACEKNGNPGFRSEWQRSLVIVYVVAVLFAAWFYPVLRF